MKMTNVLKIDFDQKGEEAFHQSVEKVNTTSKILSANLKSDEKQNYWNY